jgi:hypothetical protein
MFIRSEIDLARRSIFTTTNVSPSLKKLRMVSSSSRPWRLVPDRFSLRMVEQPVASNAAIWTLKS